MKPILVHTLKPLRSSAPPSSILNPAFRYTPAQHTDLRATFARARQVPKPRELDAETDARR